MKNTSTFIKQNPKPQNSRSVCKLPCTVIHNPHAQAWAHKIFIFRTEKI